MAAKRFFDDVHKPDQPNHKRIKPRPSFASVIKEVVMVNFLENFCSTLEPMLRRVVNEEVENGLKHYLNVRPIITKSPSLRTQSALELPSLHLAFSKKLSLPIFTGSKIMDIDNKHLEILLVDKGGDGMIPTFLPHPNKIEIVVLDGDFPASGDHENWTIEEFHKNILKERNGKRPLLAGDLNIAMRDGVASVGDLEFTDNSSWIRSRRFRIGARVVVHQGTSSSSQQIHQVRIKPAMSESFVVKDHRGELYKKHYPPALHDEVWRLQKIGKDGPFHRKLSAEGINTVQEFLKLSVVDSHKLRKILGIGMSEKMWEVTLKHAWTCEMRNKLYVSRGSNYIIILNPICQVVKAVINGQLVCANRDLPVIHKDYIEKLVKYAYANWKSLEEIDAQVNETALLTMGELEVQIQHEQQKTSTGLTAYYSNNQVEYYDWPMNLSTSL